MIDDEGTSAEDLEAQEELAELYATVPASTSLSAHLICMIVGGCAPEGRLAGAHAVGRCQRCGMGILEDLVQLSFVHVSHDPPRPRR